MQLHCGADFVVLQDPAESTQALPT